MSTVTNGTATPVAFRTIAATPSLSKVLVHAGDPVGPSGPTPSPEADQVGQTLLGAARNIAAMSLDAYDAAVNAYLEYTGRVVAAGQAEWVIDLAGSNARLFTDLTARYSSAARALLGR